MTDYVTVFGEYYLREVDAVQAAIRCSARQPGNTFAVRYDCIEGLYRVVLLLKGGMPAETEANCRNAEGC